LRPAGVQRGRVAPLPELRADRATAVRSGGDRLRAPADVRARMIRVIEPATEQVLAEVPRADAGDVEQAVARAKEAFTRWRAVAPGARAQLLHALADELASRQEELALLEARNVGKPVADARAEMQMVVDTFRYYAGAPERNLGETI